MFIIEIHVIQNVAQSKLTAWKKKQESKDSSKKDINYVMSQVKNFRGYHVIHRYDDTTK